MKPPVSSFPDNIPDFRQTEGRSPPRRAFTLIELLTVIAIIGILAGILIPVTGVVRDKARSAQCISNLRQLHVGLMLYVNDDKGYLPANKAGKPWWLDLYPVYITNPAAFACPRDDAGMTDADKALLANNAANGKVSYGRLGASTAAEPMNKLFTAFENPGHCLLLTEYHLARRQLAKDWWYNWPQLPEHITRAHGGKAGVLMMDGHCKLLDPDSDEFGNLKRYYGDIPAKS
ncbi:MAG: prepilin-type N-terminal cleavage/methylation domain-containing protein [Opitutaceae bacterium]|jgi:general secretion pathway protein G|nr:prepilin-type N-terminal cleavage/methylation domain-containing protein [Opitutaceae bacterium]